MSGSPENRSYQASIQCWTIISMLQKRHLMMLACLLWYLDPPSPHQLETPPPPLPPPPKKNKTNNVKVGPPLTKLSGSAHVLNLYCKQYGLPWEQPDLSS